MFVTDAQTNGHSANVLVVSP